MLIGESPRGPLRVSWIPRLKLTSSYINHSNKALRPLNMYLNMRLPRFSLLAYIPWYNPFPSTSTTTPPQAPKLARRQSTNTVMATMPLSSNPRGELIFSSRVDKTFREGYERYRAAFERRREEKQREGRGRGWKGLRVFGRTESPVRITVTPTPPMSRRGTPPLGSTVRGGRTPSPGLPKSGLRTEGVKGDSGPDEKSRGERERSDSYSFVLTGPGSREPSLRPDR